MLRRIVALTAGHELIVTRALGGVTDGRQLGPSPTADRSHRRERVEVERRREPGGLLQHPGSAQARHRVHALAALPAVIRPVGGVADLEQAAAALGARPPARQLCPFGSRIYPRARSRSGVTRTADRCPVRVRTARASGSSRWLGSRVAPVRRRARDRPTRARPPAASSQSNSESVSSRTGTSATTSGKPITAAASRASSRSLARTP